MDTPSPITHIGLCAGYGGIELGLHRVIRTLRSVALCEIEAFACANLVAKMEAGLLDCAPIWTDLKTFPWAEFRDRVDILTGGYPCQPFSAAGKRLGTEDPRHLWPFIADGIRILRPKLCFFENVEGHISLGLREVIGELESIGYQTAWGIFSASEVGAPHQRKRVFILAVSNSLGGAAGLSRSLAGHEGIAGVADHGGGQGGGELADPNGRRFQQCESKPKQADNAGLTSKQVWPSPNELVNAKHLGHDAPEINGGYPAGADSRWTQEPQVHGQPARGCRDVWPSRPGEQQHAWEPPRVVGAGLAHTGSLGRRGRSDGDAGGLRGEIQTAGSCGGGAETMGNAASPRRSRTEDTGANCGDEGQGPRSEESERAGLLGHTSSQRCEQDAALRGEQQPSGISQECGPGVAEAMGHPNSPRPQERPRQRGAGIQGADADGREDTSGQAQSPMGRDADGPAGGLGYAELCVSCDNRTDELRLLGNGVVPATAERAFLTLWEELSQQQPTN